MKVLMTTDNVGGVWTYCLQLVATLSSEGDDVIVAVVGNPSTAEIEALEASGAYAWEAEDYPLEWMPDPWIGVDAAGDWLLALATEHQVDVVHLNSFAHAALDWRRPVVVVAHSDVATWWRAVHQEDPPPEWDLYRTAVLSGLRAASAVVAPTHALLRELKSCYRFETRSAVIHNGLAGVPRAGGEKEPLLVSVGRVWDEAKNLELAAAASSDLPWPFVVVGDGQIPGVNCLGRLEPAEVQRVLGRAAIFVAPAVYEPFGLAALEAARAGCALVLGDIPSLREVWGEAAVHVPPRDPEAVRAAVKDLLGDTNRLGELQSAAAERSLQYTAEGMGEQYRQLYALVSEREAVSTGAER